MKHVTKNGIVKKTWESWEVDVLNTHYEKWGVDYCLSLLPDRTRGQLVGKANKLGLLRENNKRFKGNKSSLNSRTCAVGLKAINCGRCETLLEVNNENFYPRRSGQYSTICKRCRTVRQRELRDSSISKHLGRLVSGAIKRKGGNAKPSDLYRLWEKQEGKCAITGLDLLFGSKAYETDRYKTISIDRIDSSKPYDVDNIQLVCLWVNIGKQVLSVEELKDWCRLVLNPLK